VTGARKALRSRLQTVETAFNSLSTCNGLHITAMILLSTPKNDTERASKQSQETA